MRYSAARALVALLFGLVVVAGPLATWWAISPSLTVKAIADASTDGDETRFRSYLDIPALRANAMRRAEDDLHRRTAGARGMRMNDHAVASALVGPLVNRLLSDATTYDMVHRKDRDSGREISYIVMREGANWFEIRFVAPFPLVLQFRRTWFRWRIVDAWIDGKEQPDMV